MLRRHPCKNLELRQPLQKSLLFQVIQLPARDTFLRTACDPKLSGDGKRCVRMISRNHHRGNPRLRKPLHRRLRLRSDRILHTDKAEKYHVPLLHTALRFHGQRKHTPSLPHQTLLYAKQPLALRHCERRHTAAPETAPAVFQNPLRRAFRIGSLSAFLPMQRGHHFSFGIKPHLVYARMPFPEPRCLDAAILRHMEKRQLRGISRPLLVDLRVVAEHTSQKEVIRTGAIRSIAESRLKKLRKSGFFRKLSIQITLCHSHLVLGQRPGLVRADHLHRPQRLHRRKPAHNGFRLYHAGHAQSKHNRHNGRQSLRHSRHRKGDGSQKHVSHIPLLQQSHNKEQHTNPHRKGAQHLSKLSQPYLQRRQLLFMPVQHVRYMADPRVHTRGCHHT